MEIIQVKCPSCVTDVEIDASSELCFCKYCGKEIRAVNEKTITKEKVNDASCKKRWDVPSVIALIFLILMFSGMVGLAVDNAGNNSFRKFVDSYIDEKQIVGSWKMDTSDYGEGIELLGNISNKIVLVTFYSDGNCTVGDGVNAESGIWSITDGQLIIIGSIGGMFLKYDGFASPYSLEGDVLTVYHNNSTDVYYRE